MRAFAPLRTLTLACLAVAAPAQEPDPAEVAAAAATAIREWAREFECGRLGTSGILRRSAGLQPAYAAPCRRGGFLRSRDEERLTHLDVLQKLLYFAESHPSTDLADAVLGVAAARLESSFLDLQALQLREIGHWSLMRMEHQGAWFLVLRAAAGERVPLLAEARREEEEQGEGGLAVGPGRRVAALRLLGMKGLPVFRSTIGAALRDPDPRVRLAAAEALDFQRRPESLPAALAAVQVERHPVVSQALVRLVGALLRTGGEKLEPGQRAAALAVALRQFGTSGWRTDMDLLALVEAFPHKEAIPVLLDALERAKAPADPLLRAVNRRASPQLRDRAWQLLRGMTGALLAAEDVAGWRRFWAQEQDHIVVPATLPKDRPQNTRAQFFGVPVSGGAIAFVVDTSGSMGAGVAGTAAGGESERATTRLAAAKEQMALAVQMMDPEASFTVWTFAGTAHLWTPAPVRAGPHAARALTELLSRLRSHGGTNLYEGLARSLQIGELAYGQQHETKVDELFVLSDGEPTAGEIQDAEGLLQVVREANRYAKVRIHTIFTGQGQGADLLRRLAEQNDGVFVQR
ncbi:MAG: VWA domain-containing protein [Planctomycetes bacterium]|nr:VWA domain-containing protein [Planctomycetota bacterium]